MEEQKSSIHENVVITIVALVLIGIFIKIVFF